MKIGLACNNYPPFVGGIEIHAQQIAQELSKRHEVVVAAMNFEVSRLPRRLGMLHHNLLARSTRDRMDGDIPIHSLAPSTSEKLMMLPMAMRAMPRLQRWFYHEINRITHPFYARVVAPKIAGYFAGCDIVHSLAGGDLGQAAEKAARREGAAFICTPFVHPGQWGDGPDDGALYSRADAVIGLVQSDRDHLEKIGVPAGKLHVIGVSPNLPAEVDGAAFRKKHGLNGKPMVLYIGRMMKQKGAFAIIEASGLIWKSHPDVQFVFIGPAGADEQKIFDGCDMRIRYLGKVSLREKADALSACNVFCMPSTSEILPTVYLEAWSLGKPVIGGTAHGLRELVEGNGAGVCSIQAPVELASAIVSILDNDNLKTEFGTNGRNLVVKQYSIEAVVSQLENLYKSVAPHRTPDSTGISLHA